MRFQRVHPEATLFQPTTGARYDGEQLRSNHVGPIPNNGLTGNDWNEMCDVVEDLERRLEVNDLVNRNIQIAANTIKVIQEARACLQSIRRSAAEQHDHAVQVNEFIGEQGELLDHLMKEAQQNADILCKMRATATERPGRSGNRRDRNGQGLHNANAVA